MMPRSSACCCAGAWSGPPASGGAEAASSGQPRRGGRLPGDQRRAVAFPGETRRDPTGERAAVGRQPTHGALACSASSPCWRPRRTAAGVNGLVFATMMASALARVGRRAPARRSDDEHGFLCLVRADANTCGSPASSSHSVRGPAAPAGGTARSPHGSPRQTARGTGELPAADGARISPDGGAASSSWATCSTK